MTAVAHQNIINAERAESAQRRLVALANYVFGEGFLPDVAAVAAGYPHRAAALKAARHAGRYALADALRPPSTTERRAAQAEDLAFLLDTGEHADRAATRCGFTNTDKARELLHRWGHHDLADRLLPEVEDVDEWDAA